MKKIIGITVAVMMIAVLTVVVNAGAFNPAGGCKTSATIYKADPAAVVKAENIVDGAPTEGYTVRIP